MASVSTRSARKPGSTAINFEKLRSNRPPPTSKTTAMASCVATSAPKIRRSRRPVDVRAPSLSASPRGRDSSRAGRMPQSSGHDGDCAGEQKHSCVESNLVEATSSTARVRRVFATARRRAPGRQRCRSTRGASILPVTGGSAVRGRHAEGAHRDLTPAPWRRAINSEVGARDHENEADRPERPTAASVTGRSLRQPATPRSRRVRQPGP